MLATSLQDDFSAGIYRGANRVKVPTNSAYDIVNRFVDSSGALVKRGGMTTLWDDTSLEAFPFIWFGKLRAGEFLGTWGAQYYYAGGAAHVGYFGIIESDWTLTTLLISASEFIFDRPRAMASLAGTLAVRTNPTYGANDDTYFVYGGTRKTSAYTTGTASATNGSETVTGSGTTWSTNLTAGMFFRIGSSTGGGEDFQLIESVDSNTQLTLVNPWSGATASGAAYAAVPHVWSSYLRSGSDRPSAAGGLTVAGRRLLVANQHDTVWFSDIDEPTSFTADNRHRIPGGGNNRGLAGLDRNCLVFTSAGVWKISGLLDPITDGIGNPQHRIDQISDSIILWDDAGIVPWAGRLIVPAIDGIYLMDGVSEPVLISDGISPLYREYVAAGYVPGGAAVYQGHYILPIIDSDGTSDPDMRLKDTLVCNLEHGPRPFTRFNFETSRTSPNESIKPGPLTYAVRRGENASSAPKLVAGTSEDGAAGTGHAGYGKIVDCSGFFNPSADIAADPAETTSIREFVASVTTRDYPTSTGAPAVVRRIRVERELTDADADDPTIAVTYTADDTSSGSVGDSSIAEGTDPEAMSVGVRARRIRFTLTTSGYAAKDVLRAIKLFIRPTGRQ